MIYGFGEFELDTSTIELRRAGEVVHLEPQVYGVLAHLLENRDRVVSKIELLDEVWPDRFVSESALTSRIRAARLACDDTGRDQRVIRTKHGRGYRFVADVVEIADDASPASPPAPAPALPAAGPGDAIGRTEELATLDAAAASALGGAGRIVVISGEAGMGKSTVVDTVVERLEGSTDLRVMTARCRAHRERPEPYVALLDAVSRFARVQGGDVVEMLERVAPMWLVQLPSLVEPDHVEALERRVLGGTHERMLREGVDLLDHLSVHAPLVLLIEDIHWSDPSTLELLRWLSGRVEFSPLLVLATRRPGDDPTGEVDAAVAEMTMERVAEEIELKPLAGAELGRLVADRFDADDADADLVDVLFRRSAGNPLFAIEQVEAWRREGTAVIADGSLSAVGGPDALGAAVPEGVRQLIERSLSNLDDHDVEILEAAAVVGQEFPAFAVAAALDLSIPDVEDRLGALARRGSFVTASGDEAWSDGTVSTVFRLTHDHHHQVLYERIAASRRATFHQQVGLRLEEAFEGSVDEQVALLLRHFEASNDIERSVRYLMRMGELSLARGAHGLAIEPLENALALIESLPAGDERDRREVDIRAALGPALTSTLGWQQPDVQANYERALELAIRLDADPERFVVRWGLASVHELRGEYNRSEELLVEQVEDGAELGVETHELLACSTFHQGAYERSLEYSTTGIELWEPDTHSSFMARFGEHPGVSCSTWGALAAWYLGQAERSLALARRAVELGAENEYALTTAGIQFAFLHQFRDEPRPARFWAEATIDLADAQGFPFRAAQASMVQGWCDAVEVDPDQGVAVIEEGLARYRATGARMDEPYFLGLLADAERRAGRLDDALAHLDEADEVIAATTRSFFFEPELDRLRAAALVARDGSGSSTAEDAIDRSIRTADDHDSPVLALRSLTTALELGLGDPAVARDRLDRLLAVFGADGDLSDVRRARAALADPG